MKTEFLSLDLLLNLVGLAVALPVLSQSTEHPYRLGRHLGTSFAPATGSDSTSSFDPTSRFDQTLQPASTQSDLSPSFATPDRSMVSGTRFTTDDGIHSLENLMWERVNEDRAEYRSPAIRMDPQLSSLARKYAEFMMHADFFAHIDPNGRNPEDRARASGIKCGVYENISWCSRDGNDLKRLKESEAGMMAEPAGEQNHRSNILLTQHVAMGIGIARNHDKIYMVQEFADLNP